MAHDIPVSSRTTPPQVEVRQRRRGVTETKAAYKTTELGLYLLTVLGVLIASAVVDGFGAQDAWFYVSLLTIGYLVSRGLAKSGSRESSAADGG